MTALQMRLNSEQANEEAMLMAELEEIVRQGEKNIAEGNFQPIAIDELWK